MNSLWCGGNSLWCGGKSHKNRVYADRAPAPAPAPVIEGCPEEILEIIASKLDDSSLVSWSFCSKYYRGIAQKEIKKRIEEGLSYVNDTHAIKVRIEPRCEDDFNTVKRWIEGIPDEGDKINMNKLELISSALKSNTPARYLMIRNVIFCGKKSRDGEDGELCKDTKDQIKLHIMKGDLIEHIIKKFPNFSNSFTNPLTVFIYAVQHGHLEMVKYLVDTFHLKADDVRCLNNCALRSAAGNGHLEMAEYLVDTFHFTADHVRKFNNHTLGDAAENGHMEMVKYLVDTFHLIYDYDGDAVDDALRDSAGNGHMAIFCCIS